MPQPLSLKCVFQTELQNPRIGRLQLNPAECRLCEVRDGMPQLKWFQEIERLQSHLQF